MPGWRDGCWRPAGLRRLSQSLTAAEPNPAKNAAELADLHITVLDALDRNNEAQALRWTEFERGLRAEPLRAYLKRLSDFADVEKEEKALDWVAAHPDVHAALGIPDHLA